MSKDKLSKKEQPQWLSQQSAAALEAMQTNLAGEKIEFSDLPRAKNPSGGSTLFDLGENEDLQKSLVGIILYHQCVRVFWQDDDASGTPPDCFCGDTRSNQGRGIRWDGDTLPGINKETGEVIPPHDCTKCPLNEFGSAANQKGKACKESRLIALLRPGKVLPTIVRITPANLKKMKQYLVGLAGDGIRMHDVVTEIKLVKAKNSAGKEYAEQTVFKHTDLTEEEKVDAAERAQAFIQMFVGVSAEDLAEEASE